MDSAGQADQLRADGEDSTALRPGGEFRSRLSEAAFAAGHAIENHRHGRALLIASVLLNTLFFASDWRFAGTPHFWVAIPARALVVVAALAGLLLLRRSRTPAAKQRVMAAWMAVNAIGVSALVSSHSDIALFVVIMLPIIYYLAVPVPFAWTLAGGIGCSVLMLASYEYGHSPPGTSLGLMLAMLILNVALTMVVSRSNRLQRLAWQAMRAERRTSAELASSREQIETMLAVSPVPMIITTREDGGIVRINDSAHEFLGTQPGQAVETNVAGFYADAEDRQRLLGLIDRDGAVRDFEMRVRRGDGAIRTVLIKARSVELGGRLLIMSGIIDISDRKAVENDLERLAATDALTGLPNRLSFFATGRSEIVRASRLGAPVALLMVDLDHFKQVNDGHGHVVGDEALRSFAVTCRAVLGDAGSAARLGGEEFGVLLPNADLAAAMHMAERLRAAIEQQPVRARRSTIRLTASIGVAVIDPDDRDLDRALARADAALYAAKRGGRNRVVADRTPSVRRAV